MRNKLSDLEQKIESHPRLSSLIFITLIASIVVVFPSYVAKFLACNVSPTYCQYFSKIDSGHEKTVLHPKK